MVGDVGGEWFRDHACRCPAVTPATCFRDDEWVTHYGRLNSSDVCEHKFGPLPQDAAPGLSVTRGRRAVEEIAPLIGVTTARKLARSCVRFALVGELRAVGFAVLHMPTDTNENHGSVIYPASDPLFRQACPWPITVSTKWNECFTGCRMEVQA